MNIGPGGTGVRLLVFVSGYSLSLDNDLTTNNDFVGVQLKKQLRNALKFSDENRKVSDIMTENWAPSIIAGWKARLHAFHLDNSLPNPFKDPEPGEWCSDTRGPPGHKAYTFCRCDVSTIASNSRRRGGKQARCGRVVPPRHHTGAISRGASPS